MKKTDLKKLIRKILQEQGEGPRPYTPKKGKTSRIPHLWEEMINNGKKLIKEQTPLLSCGPCGDVEGTGVVTSQDASILMQYTQAELDYIVGLGESVPPVECPQNVPNEGAQGILNFIVGKAAGLTCGGTTGQSPGPVGQTMATGGQGGFQDKPVKGRRLTKLQAKLARSQRM